MKALFLNNLSKFESRAVIFASTWKHQSKLWLLRKIQSLAKLRTL
jgi:hypothetical protein